MTFQNILNHKKVYFFMAFWLFVLSCAPSNSFGMTVSSYSYLKDATRQQDIEKITQFLTTPTAKKQLLKLGLNEQLITTRLDKLSDEQIHTLVAKIDTIKAGGDATAVIILVLFIIILILVILYLTDYQVKVEKKHK